MTKLHIPVHMNRQAAQYGALLAGLGLALGAFGSHALRPILSPEALNIFETGVRYQMYHALALLILAGLGVQGPIPLMMLVGILIFSSSLYVLALSGVGILGAITPIGGVVMLVAWGMLFLQLGKK